MKSINIVALTYLLVSSLNMCAMQPFREDPMPHKQTASPLAIAKTMATAAINVPVKASQFPADQTNQEQTNGSWAPPAGTEYFPCGNLLQQY